MSVRLSVTNLPHDIPLSDFKAAFSDLRGFKDAKLIYNDKHQVVSGQLEFTSYEFAEYAKKIMNGFMLSGSNCRITIDFIRPDYNDLFTYPAEYTSDFYQKGLNPVPNNMSKPYFQNSQIPQSSQKNDASSFANINNNNKTQLQQHQNPSNPQTADYRQSQNFPGSYDTFIPRGPPINYPQYTAPPPQQFQAIPNPLQGFYPQRSQMPGDMAAMFGNFMNACLRGNNPGQSSNEPGNLNSSNNMLPSPTIFTVPQDGTNSLYIDGIPIDSHEREVAHIFRPFPGYHGVRLIRKEGKNGRKFYFCFVDFDSPLNATVAKETLQGYRFHKNDKKGLKISYANNPESKSKKKQLNFHKSACLL